MTGETPSNRGPGDTPGADRLARFDDLTSRLAEEMAASYRAESQWDDAVRAALTALLSFLDEDPALARFLIVDSLAGDADIVARRRLVRERLVHALEAIAPPAQDGSQSGPFDAETIVATIAAILHARLVEEPVPPLHELRGALMGVIVLPHLGAEAARAELLRPLPPRPPSRGDQ